MSKHTPGPWEVVETLGKTAIAMPSENIGIADVIICHIWPQIKIGEPKANARLIASAPELLEACRLALGYCWKSTSYNPEKELEQAITKAEGGK